MKVKNIALFFTAVFFSLSLGVFLKPNQVQAVGGGGPAVTNRCVWLGAARNQQGADLKNMANPLNWATSTLGLYCDITDVNNPPQLDFDFSETILDENGDQWVAKDYAAKKAIVPYSLDAEWKGITPVSGSSVFIGSDALNDKVHVVGFPSKLNNIDVRNGFFEGNTASVTVNGSINITGKGKVWNSPQISACPAQIEGSCIGNLTINNPTTISASAADVNNVPQQFAIRKLVVNGKLTFSSLNSIDLKDATVDVNGNGSINLGSGTYLMTEITLFNSLSQQNFNAGNSSVVYYNAPFGGGDLTNLLPAYNKVTFKDVVVVGGILKANVAIVSSTSDVVFDNVQINSKEFVVDIPNAVNNGRSVLFKNGTQLSVDTLSSAVNQQITFDNSVLTLNTNGSSLIEAGSNVSFVNSSFNLLAGSAFENNASVNLTDSTTTLDSTAVFTNNGVNSGFGVSGGSFTSVGQNTSFANNGGVVKFKDAQVIFKNSGVDPFVNNGTLTFDNSPVYYSGTGSVIVAKADSGYGVLTIGKDTVVEFATNTIVMDFVNNGEATIDQSVVVDVQKSFTNNGVINELGSIRYPSKRINFTNEDGTFDYNQNGSLINYTFTNSFPKQGYVLVEDANRNLDATKNDTVTVAVISTGTGDSLHITATETGPSTGVFIAGPIPFQIASDNKVGALKVSATSIVPDTLDVVYVDPTDNNDTQLTAANNNVNSRGLVYFNLDLPLNVRLDNVTTSSVRVLWDANPANNGIDNILYSVNGFPNQVDTEKTFFNLDQNTWYEFRVVALTNNYSSISTYAVSTTTLPAPYPFSSLSSQAFGPESIYIAWQQKNAGDETDVVIYENGQRILKTPIVVNGKRIQGVIVSGLTPNTMHTFDVGTTDGVLESGLLQVGGITFPEKPVIESVQADSQTQFTAVINAGNYFDNGNMRLVNADTGDAIAANVVSLMNGKFNAVADKLSCGTTYHVAAIYTNILGLDSEKSNAATISTDACPQDPAHFDHMVVTPTSSIVNGGGTQQFAVSGVDQYGNPIAAPAVTWSVDDGGTIDPATGLFTAFNQDGGPYTVTASDGSGNASATATVMTVKVNQRPTIVKLAEVNPAPVTGSAAQLSVLADDADTGEGSLVYSWKTIAAPAQVVFVKNNSNDAKNTPVTFVAAGQYTFEVTATDPQGAAITSQVSVQVVQTISRITVFPANPTVMTNETQQFTVKAFDQFGATMLAPEVTWNASDNQVIDKQTGIFTAGAQAGGPYTITADDGAGHTASASITVVDQPVVPALTSIEIDPATAHLTVGDTQQFTVKAFDQNGNNFSAPQVTWSATTNGKIDAATGLFTADAEGTFEITADDSNGHTATIPVTVKNAPAHLTSIVVKPATVTLTIGDTKQFTISALDQYGNGFNAPVVTWTVDNSGTIDQNTGLFTANKIGQFTITADAGNGITNTATVTVNALPQVAVVNSITVDPSSATLTMGNTQQFSVSALDQFGKSIQAPAVVWTVDNGGTIDANGVFTADKVGQFIVTATDADKHTSTATVTVNEQLAVSRIEITPAQVDMFVGNTQQFGYVAYDQHNNVMKNVILNVQWSTNSDGAIDNSGLFTAGKTIGQYTVTVRDVDGHTSIGSVTVSEPKVQPVLNSIKVSPASVTLTVGDTKQFSASAFDQFNNAFNLPVLAWSVDNGGSIDGSGLFTANKVGQFTVYADAGNKIIGSASITVNPVQNPGGNSGGQSNVGGGGGGGGGAVTPAPSNPQVSVKAGSINTVNNTVTLLLSATNTPTLMAISVTSSFANVSFVPYATTSVWNFGPASGQVTVYAKFANNGGSSLATSTTFTVVRDIIQPEPQVLGEKISHLDELIAMTKFGEKSANVKELQTELKKAGYFAKSWKPTNYYGTATRAAVQKYQADKLTLDELIAQTKYGQNNYKVFRLQTELKKLGFMAKNWKPTYYYGTATKKAVAKYQASK